MSERSPDEELAEVAVMLQDMEGRYHDLLDIVDDLVLYTTMVQSQPTVVCEHRFAPPVMEAMALLVRARPNRWRATVRGMERIEHDD